MATLDLAGLIRRLMVATLWIVFLSQHDLELGEILLLLTFIPCWITPGSLSVSSGDLCSPCACREEDPIGQFYLAGFQKWFEVVPSRREQHLQLFRDCDLLLQKTSINPTVTFIRFHPVSSKS